MENILFYFCSAAGPEASGTPNFNKRAVSSISGSQEEESCEPPPLSPAGSSVLPKSTPSAHSWSQVRSVILESPISRCPTAGSTGVVSRSLASAPQTVPVAPADHQAQLHNYICPASPQVQGHPVHFI